MSNQLTNIYEAFHQISLNFHSSDENSAIQYDDIRKFAKIGVPPVIIHLWMDFFPEINHPAFLGYPHDELETP